MYRKSFDNKDVPVEVCRKVTGLMERFTSKAKLFKIMKNPPQPYNNINSNTLNQSIWELYQAKAQKEKSYLSKLAFWKTLYLNLSVSTQLN